MITLTELTAYLPYKLMCMVDGHKAELHGVYSDGTCTLHQLVESEHGFESIKPILKPVIDADAYIRAHFELYSTTGEGYDALVINLFCYENIHTDELLVEIDLNKLPHNAYMWLLQNHYDVFGLLERGKAITA
jgi:hypothetical protein